MIKVYHIIIAQRQIRVCVARKKSRLYSVLRIKYSVLRIRFPTNLYIIFILILIVILAILTLLVIAEVPPWCKRENVPTYLEIER